MQSSRVFHLVVSFCVLASALRATPSESPYGNCTDLPLMDRLNAWCASTRRYPLPKHYICPDNSRLISVADHNYFVNRRVEGIPFAPAVLDCARYCGHDPYLTRVIPFYAFNDVETRDQVDSVVVCQCPNIVAGQHRPPPTPGQYRLELRKKGYWEDLAAFDRACSGRGNLEVETHNARLEGKRCNSQGRTRRMVCAEGQIDHCSRHESGPNGIGAMPWNHRCVAAR